MAMRRRTFQCHPVLRLPGNESYPQSKGPSSKVPLACKKLGQLLNVDKAKLLGLDLDFIPHIAVADPDTKKTEIKLIFEQFKFLQKIRMVFVEGVTGLTKPMQGGEVLADMLMTKLEPKSQRPLLVSVSPSWQSDDVTIFSYHDTFTQAAAQFAKQGFVPWLTTKFPSLKEEIESKLSPQIQEMTEFLEWDPSADELLGPETAVIGVLHNSNRSSSPPTQLCR